jgi:transmembrane protein DUF3566
VSKPDDRSPGSPPRPGEPRRTQQIPRPTGQPVKKVVEPKKSAQPGGPPKSKKPHLVDPVDEAKKGLSADEYSRTTTGSPSSTAVIPAVKDDPPKGGPSSASSPRREPERPPTTYQGGRRASLRLVHIEPWSVTRLAFVISVAMMIVSVVAVSIFWIVLNVTGVWGQINDSVTSILSDDTGTFDIKDYLGFGRMFGLTLVLSAINVILLTALATIGAHLYNLAAQLLGGVEVTFSED